MQALVCTASPDCAYVLAQVEAQQQHSEAQAALYATEQARISSDESLLEAKKRHALLEEQLASATASLNEQLQHAHDEHAAERETLQEQVSMHIAEKESLQEAVSAHLVDKDSLQNELSANEAGKESQYAELLKQHDEKIANLTADWERSLAEQISQSEAKHKEEQATLETQVVTLESRLDSSQRVRLPCCIWSSGFVLLDVLPSLFSVPCRCTWNLRRSTVRRSRR